MRDGEEDLGFLLGCGFGLWVSWVAGTSAGLIVGDAVGDRLADFGLDTLLLTYFAALLVPLWSGRSSLVPWIAAAVASIWGRQFLPEGWNVLAAAVVGGAFGALSRVSDTTSVPGR